MSAITVTGLSHSFDSHRVLDDLNVEIPAGQVCYVLGSSGGGKTTFLKCLSGLITATEGQVQVDAVDVRKSPVEARQRMGMVFQSAALFDYLTVEENVLFGLRRRSDLDRSAAKKWAAECLDRVGLEGRVGQLLPSELSGGMRKRAGIARAIALKPTVMLYDEPTTGLDPITTFTIDQLIRDLVTTTGMTSVVVSHDVTSMVRTADRVLFLHRGKIVFDGIPKEFMGSSVESIQELVQKSTATEL
jgi:phospholipid/cholesterol/gamma-HCH transport system ATP-binding protein